MPPKYPNDEPCSERFLNERGGPLYPVPQSCPISGGALADHILPALDGVPDRPKRIEVIRAFQGWLRRHRHLVKPAEDPTLHQGLAAVRAALERLTKG